MSEFAPELTVVTKSDGQIRMRNLTQLLPESFQLNSVEKFAIQAEKAAEAMTSETAAVEPETEPQTEETDEAAEEPADESDGAQNE